ncbi:TonB-dependent siderophore receptor [Massilia sp. BSC265]|uniref:TonB-dependent receptor n=1 Tax=Massilia sp. BSC265 TaxID=1549812 RepID=UPI0004E89301|nr:TonB-dependent siderophore receptor [Massilia sp. BSC265]KFI06806.1 TonB-dependent receptor [Massilia sp. BSC265]
MTTITSQASSTFIKSKKHSRPSAPVMSASAMAVLATLAMPLAHATGLEEAPELHEGASLPKVVVNAGADRAVQGPVKSSSDKFTAPLLDTPKSVTVVTSETISQTGAVSLTDALRTVPGITIGASEGGNPVGDNLFIRGYNAQTDTYIDGVRDSGSQSREIFAIEQVEVVKGPNSALGGRSSAGGGINIVTKTAKDSNFNNATVGLGTDKYARVTADLNRVVGENTAFRLNAMVHANDVAGRDIVNNERWGIAPTVTFGLNGPTRAILSYYHMESHEIPDTGIPFNNPVTSGPDVAKNGGGTPFTVDREAFYGLKNRDFRDTKTDVATVDLRHEFSPNLAIRNVSRWGKTGQDYVYTQPDDSKGNTVRYGTVWRRANTRDVDTRTLANSTSLTGNFATAGIKHSFNVGVEFSREDTDRGSFVFSPGTNNPRTGTFTCPTAGAATLYNCTTLVNPNPYDPWVYTRTKSPTLTTVETRTRAVYGFDTIEFTPQWLLNLGARWDDFSSALFTPATATAGVTRARVESNFDTYQAGLVYKPKANGSVYVSWATSATPPGNDGGDGLDALTVQIQNLQPQKSRSIELGTKWEVLPGGRLSVSAAVFKNDMDNARVTAPDGTTQNVGRKEMKGVEFGLSGRITNAWTVFGGYTYLDGIIADNGYVNANAGTTAAPRWIPSPFNGNAFPTTPKHSASLWTTYAVSRALTIGGGANFVDRQFANVNNTKYSPAYTRFDAMATYTLSPNVSFQLNIQNLTDKLYFDRVSSPHYAGVGPGRSATLMANLKF